MGKRETKRLSQSALRMIALAVLSGAFLFGGLGGCIFVGLSNGEGEEELRQYLTQYMQLLQTQLPNPSFWSIFWLQGRYFLAAGLLGFTALGVAGFPVLFALRGFLLSFSIASCYRVFGMIGSGYALILFGIPALVWLPGLFLAGVQGMAGSEMLLFRSTGDTSVPSPFCSLYWKRLWLSILLLLCSSVLEYRLVPVALRAISKPF